MNDLDRKNKETDDNSRMNLPVPVESAGSSRRGRSRRDRRMAQRVKKAALFMTGALAFGTIAGGAMVFIWKYLIAPMGGAFSIYELLPAFIVSLIAIVVVSLATAPPAQEIVEEFEAVGKM